MGKSKKFKNVSENNKLSDMLDINGHVYRNFFHLSGEATRSFHAIASSVDIIVDNINFVRPY